MNQFHGTDRAILLRDGRMLGYAEYGDPAGRPVIHVHGFPSSRLEGRLLHEGAVAAGARLLSVDLPGIGLSDPHPDLSPLAWTADVGELADALHLDRFAVLGVSSGAPWALACGRRMPERLVGLAIVAGVGLADEPAARSAIPFGERIAGELARRAPPVARGLAALLAARLRRWPERFVDEMIRSSAEPDRSVLARPEVRAHVPAMLLESARGGTEGLVDHAARQLEPWGFRPSEVAVKVHLFHGDRDGISPPESAHRLVAQLPSCEARFLEEEGHLSLLGRAPEFLAAVLGVTGSVRGAA